MNYLFAFAILASSSAHAVTGKVTNLFHEPSYEAMKVAAEKMSYFSEHLDGQLGRFSAPAISQKTIENYLAVAEVLVTQLQSEGRIDVREIYAHSIFFMRLGHYAMIWGDRALRLETVAQMSDNQRAKYLFLSQQLSVLGCALETDVRLLKAEVKQSLPLLNI